MPSCRAVDRNDPARGEWKCVAKSPICLDSRADVGQIGDGVALLCYRPGHLDAVDRSAKPEVGGEPLLEITNLPHHRRPLPPWRAARLHRKMHVVSHQAVCKQADLQAFHPFGRKLQVPPSVSNIAKNRALLDTSSYDVVESPPGNSTRGWRAIGTIYNNTTPSPIPPRRCSYQLRVSSMSPLRGGEGRPWMSPLPLKLRAKLLPRTPGSRIPSQIVEPAIELFLLRLRDRDSLRIRRDRVPDLFCEADPVLHAQLQDLI